MTNFRRLFISLVIVACLNAGLRFGLEAAPVPQDSPQAFATLAPGAGNITLLRNGTNVWETVTTPQQVSIGDRIRTGSGSNAVVFWFEDMRLELYENSEIYLNDFRSNADGSFRVEMTQVIGMSIHRLDRPFDDRSRYLVSLPAVQIASSPGTVGVQVEPDFDTGVLVSAGAALASHISNQQVINAGGGLFIPRYAPALGLPGTLDNLSPALITTIQTPLAITPQSTIVVPAGVGGTAEPGALVPPPGGTREPGFTPEPGDDHDDDDHDDDDHSGSGGGDDHDDDDDH